MSSTADIDEVVEVSEDGLTVRKSFAADEFPVPAIRFEIESSHDGSVSFRIVEQIPESFPMDGVGFHPDYYSDNWTAFQDNHVEFTGTVDPDETLVTVYGIRLDDDDDPSEFLDEPTIAELRTDGSTAEDVSQDADTVDDTMIDDIISDDRNQVVKDMLAGESDTVPGLDEQPDDTTTDQAAGDDAVSGLDSEQTGANTAAETPGDDPTELDLDLGDVDTEPVEVTDEDEEDDTPDIDLSFGEESIPEPDADADATDDDEGEGDDQDEDDVPEIELDLEAAAASADEEDDAERSDEDSAPKTETTVATDADSVASQLVSEIERGAIDDDDLEVLRRELDVGMTASQRSRLTHLQSRVEQVAAYTSALEEFIDENGTGKELIEEVRDDLESLETELSSVADRLDDTASDVSDVDDRVETVDDNLTTLRGDVRALKTTLRTVGETVDRHDDKIESVNADVDALEADLEDVAEEVEDVREDVTDIKEWRSQLGSMFSD